MSRRYSFGGLKLPHVGREKPEENQNWRREAKATERRARALRLVPAGTYVRGEAQADSSRRRERQRRRKRRRRQEKETRCNVVAEAAPLRPSIGTEARVARVRGCGRRRRGLPRVAAGCRGTAERENGAFGPCTRHGTVNAVARTIQCVLARSPVQRPRPPPPSPVSARRRVERVDGGKTAAPSRESRGKKRRKRARGVGAASFRPSSREREKRGREATVAWRPGSHLVRSQAAGESSHPRDRSAEEQCISSPCAGWKRASLRHLSVARESRPERAGAAM